MLFKSFVIKLDFMLFQHISIIFNWVERSVNHIGDENILPSAAVKNIGQ